MRQEKKKQDTDAGRNSRAATAGRGGTAGLRDSSSAGLAAGTRERILRMLLSRRRSVSSLASELGITKNAVRAQLFQLEKQGLVGARGEERTSRRPSALYGLMPGAEARFSRAYPAAFSGLIRVLSRKLPPKEFEQAMRELGRGMADRRSRLGEEPEDRIEAARSRLESLGSMTELHQVGNRYILSTDSCPIGEAVEADGRCCISMAAMIEEITGLPVTRRCEHDDARCRFEIGAAPSGKRRLRSGSRK